MDSATHAPTTPESPDQLVQGGSLSLQSSLRYGLRRNLDIRIADISTQSAEAGVDIARAQFDPRFHVSGGREYQIDGAQYEEAEAVVEKMFVTGTIVSLEGNYSSDSFFDSSHDDDLPDGFSSGSSGGRTSNDDLDSFAESFSDEDATLRIRQPLLRGASIKANRAGIDLARLDIEAADTELRAQVLEFLRGAETGYWTAAVAREIHIHEDQSLERNRRILDDARQRLDVGTASALDLLEAEAGYADAQETSVQARRRYEDALDNLWFILGLPIEPHPAAIQFEGIDRYFRPEGTPDPEKSYQQALGSFPAVLLLANTVRQSQIRVDLARNNVLPALDVEVSGRWRPKEHFAENDIVRDYDWGVFLEMSVPWTFRAERAELHRARMDLERSETARENAMRALKRDILAACRAVEVSRKQLEIAVQGATANEKKWEEQQLRFAEGLVAVRDLIEDQERTKRAQTRELEARLRLIAAWKLLEQLDGSILQRHGFTWD